VEREDVKRSNVPTCERSNATTQSKIEAEEQRSEVTLITWTPHFIAQHGRNHRIDSQMERNTDELEGQTIRVPFYP
jgi:hypothetical protein